MDGVIAAVKELRAKIETISQTLNTLADAVVNGEEKFGDAIAKKERTLNAKLCQHYNEQKEETQQIFKLQEGVVKSVDDLERRFLLPSLIIRGIPKLQNEDLYKYFTSICNHFHFSLPVHAISNIYRVPVKTNNAGMRERSSAIIVTFTSIRQRTEFLIKYLQKKDLSVNHLGIGGTSRIYISECLSKRNVHIFKIALQLKKSKLIHTTYTKSGRVFVREIHNPSQQLLIDDVKLLNKYSQSHSRTSTANVSQRQSQPHAGTSRTSSTSINNISPTPPPPPGQITISPGDDE